MKDFIEWTRLVQGKWEELDYGLSIAKEILDKNGGSIDIKSNQGKGTEVVIRIPTKGPNSKKEVGEKKNEVKKDV